MDIGHCFIGRRHQSPVSSQQCQYYSVCRMPGWNAKGHQSTEQKGGREIMKRSQEALRSAIVNSIINGTQSVMIFPLNANPGDSHRWNKHHLVRHDAEGAVWQRHSLPLMLHSAHANVYFVYLALSLSTLWHVSSCFHFAFPPTVNKMLNPSHTFRKRESKSFWAKQIASLQPVIPSVMPFPESEFR